MADYDEFGMLHENASEVGLAVTPLRGSLDGAGTIGAAFQFGGADFAPGRQVYCDADGVVVSAQPLIDSYDGVQDASVY